MKNKTRRATKYKEAKLGKTSPAAKAWTTGTSAVEKTSANRSKWRFNIEKPWPRRFIPKRPLRFYRRHGPMLLTHFIKSKELEDRGVMKRRINRWNRVLFNPRIAVHSKVGTKRPSYPLPQPRSSFTKDRGGVK